MAVNVKRPQGAICENYTVADRRLTDILANVLVNFLTLMIPNESGYVPLQC